jgi:hypothetical protein
MDWSNERYVRIYVRDTITWRRLTFDGQTVMLHLLRRLDRSGTLDLGGVDAVTAIEIVTDIPREIIERGLNKCVELEVFLIDENRLVMPNYLIAQETRTNNAERQRRHRAKIRNKIVVSDNNLSPNVTNSNENVTISNTERYHNVTCHKSNSVPYHTVPCRTNTAKSLSDPESGSGIGSSGKESSKPKETKNLKPEILEYQKKYDLDLCEKTREYCALSRNNGKMTDSVWLKTLEKLDLFSKESVERAMLDFCEKRADGQKDEKYLIGMARRMSQESPSGIQLSLQTKSIVGKNCETEKRKEALKWRAIEIARESSPTRTASGPTSAVWLQQFLVLLKSKGYSQSDSRATEILSSISVALDEVEKALGDGRYENSWELVFAAMEKSI